MSIEANARDGCLRSVDRAVALYDRIQRCTYAPSQEKPVPPKVAFDVVNSCMPGLTAGEHAFFLQRTVSSDGDLRLIGVEHSRSLRTARSARRRFRTPAVRGRFTSLFSMAVPMCS